MQAGKGAAAVYGKRLVGSQPDRSLRRNRRRPRVLTNRSIRPWNLPERCDGYRELERPWWKAGEIRTIATSPSPLALEVLSTETMQLSRRCAAGARRDANAVMGRRWLLSRKRGLDQARRASGGRHGDPRTNTTPGVFSFLGVGGRRRLGDWPRVRSRRAVRRSPDRRPGSQQTTSSSRPEPGDRCPAGYAR